VRVAAALDDLIEAVEDGCVRPRLRPAFLLFHDVPVTLLRCPGKRVVPRAGPRIHAVRPPSQAAGGRTGIPARARCAFASAIEWVPKWKMDAASTAAAWPSRMPSTMWSRVPTPPLAITGTGTASATARVRDRS